MEGWRKGEIKEAPDVDLWTPYTHTHVHLSIHKHVYTHKLESYDKGQLPVHQKSVLSKLRRVPTPDRNCLWFTQYVHWQN